MGNSWSIAIASMPSTSGFVRGYVVEAKRESEFPSSAEEGSLRHQENAREATFEGADGVVLVQKISGCLNQPPRPRLSKEREQFLMARPPLLRQGGEFFAQPRKMSKLQSRALARVRIAEITFTGAGRSGVPSSRAECSRLQRPRSCQSHRRTKGMGCAARENLY